MTESKPRSRQRLPAEKTMDLDEIGRVQQRAASIIANLTPRLAEGSFGPGGELLPPPPPTPMPDGSQVRQILPTHLVLGNRAVGSFNPGEEEKASKYLAIIESLVAAVRKEIEADVSADIKKALGAKD